MSDEQPSSLQPTLPSLDPTIQVHVDRMLETMNDAVNAMDKRQQRIGAKKERARAAKIVQAECQFAPSGRCKTKGYRDCVFCELATEIRRSSDD